MGKPLEQDLADYLLSLARGPWSQHYNRQCLVMWRKEYGDLIADRVEKIVVEKWNK